ncbi:MAG TPA: hypothetical protein VF178_08450, partial [Gemmatimonadaceae bacterium]
ELLATVTNTHARNAAVDELLRRVEGLPREAAANRLSSYGITESVLQRWRQLRRDGQDIPLPRGNVREGLQKFITELAGEQSEHDRSAEVPADLQRQIDAIRTLDVPEHVKIMELDALAAAYRSRVAVIEAEARREEASAARARAEMLGFDARAADARTWLAGFSAIAEDGEIEELPLESEEAERLIRQAVQALARLVKSRRAG